MSKSRSKPDQVKARVCLNLGPGQSMSKLRSRPDQVENLGQGQSKAKASSKPRSRPEHVKT